MTIKKWPTCCQPMPNKFKSERLKFGISVADLANLARICAATVHRLDKNGSGNVKSYRRCAKVLRVRIADLIED